MAAKVFATLCLLALAGQAFGARTLRASSTGIATLDASTVSAIAKIFSSAGLLEELPTEGVTLFLPSNEAVLALANNLQLDTSSADAAIKSLLALPADLLGRVVSALLYHVVPQELTAADLGANADGVSTLLPGASLKFNADGTEVITSAIYPGTANPFTASIIGQVAPNAFVVNTVLVPEFDITKLPVTTVDQALFILTGGAQGRSAPAPAKAPAAAPAKAPAKAPATGPAPATPKSLTAKP